MSLQHKLCKKLEGIYQITKGKHKRQNYLEEM